MKKIIAVFLAVMMTTAFAFDNWVNNYGVPVKSNTEQCWRNGSWTPASAHSDCDGAIKQVAEPKVETPKVDPIPEPAPVEETPVTKVLVKATYSADMFFDFDRSEIKPAGKQALDELTIDLKNVTINVAVAVGHTDSVGSDAYNMKLGMKRAEAVIEYLIGKGIKKDQVTAESKGKREPIADNKTASGRAQNRRVVVKVTGTE